MSQFLITVGIVGGLLGGIVTLVTGVIAFKQVSDSRTSHNLRRRVRPVILAGTITILSGVVFIYGLALAGETGWAIVVGAGTLISAILMRRLDQALTRS